MSLTAYQCRLFDKLCDQLEEVVRNAKPEDSQHAVEISQTLNNLQDTIESSDATIETQQTILDRLSRQVRAIQRIQDKRKAYTSHDDSTH